MNRLAAAAVLAAMLAVVFAVVLGGLAASLGAAVPAAAGDYGQVDYSCYRCIRDAIYADTKLIARLEADPDIDDGVKGPQIVAARADIHRLRKILGLFEDRGTAPCCYTRPPLYVR